MTLDLQAIKALVIDMDGVLWRGGVLLPGFHALFNFLQTRNIPFMLATNNARRTPEQYQQKLANFEVSIARENVLSSAVATGYFLAEELPPESRVFVIGEEGLRRAVQDAGHVLVDDLSEPVAAVVSGLDMELTYEKLKRAVVHLQQGARFIASNADLSYPIEGGLFAPGSGSILQAVTAATGIEPLVIGKPETLMFETAIRRLEINPAEAAMVGDRLDTDILGAQRAGLKTIFVTTGVDDEAAITRKGISPDTVYTGIDALVVAWEAALA